MKGELTLIFLSNKPDETGFYINQTTKVRVHKLTKEGVEVTTRSKVNKLGFIPYSNLTSTANLYDGKGLYVYYLGYNESYLYFAEEGTMVFQDVLQTTIH